MKYYIKKYEEPSSSLNPEYLLYLKNKNYPTPTNQGELKEKETALDGTWLGNLFDKVYNYSNKNYNSLSGAFARAVDGARNLYDDVREGGLSFVPGVGDTVDVVSIGDDINKGNYGSAALTAGLMALPGSAGKAKHLGKKFLNKTKKFLQETFPKIEDFQNKPTRILINSKISSAKDAYNDAMQTGIIRPSENIKTHKGELYFTNNGVYGKPKKGEYIIVPKENVTFSNTLNKHIDFKTPDNILTENFNFYTPLFFGRLRKVKTNPMKLTNEDLTSIKWDVDPRTNLGKLFLRDLHFKKASPNGILNTSHSSPYDFNSFEPKKGTYDAIDPFYHFGDPQGNTAAWFQKSSPDYNTKYYHLRLQNPVEVSDGSHGFITYLIEDMQKRGIIDEITAQNLNNKYWRIAENDPKEAAKNILEELGYDGIKYKNEIEAPGNWSFAVPTNKQMKLSDAITYDDFGDIIPLSKRDNFNISDIRYKQGGSIHIKEKNKGKFTESAKRAGKSVQEHARDVVNNPKATKLQKKRALFALNAKKWKHQHGGIMNYINLF